MPSLRIRVSPRRFKKETPVLISTKTVLWGNDSAQFRAVIFARLLRDFQITALTRYCALTALPATAEWDRG